MKFELIQVKNDNSRAFQEIFKKDDFVGIKGAKTPT